MGTAFTFGSFVFDDGANYMVQEQGLGLSVAVTSDKTPFIDENSESNSGLMARTIPLSIQIIGTDFANRCALESALVASFVNGKQALYLAEDDKYFNASLQQINGSVNYRNPAVTVMSLTMQAADPFKYYDVTANSPDEQTPDANPFTWNITVDGTAYVRPGILVTGPFTGSILLENTTNGQWVQLAASLGVGETWVIDCRHGYRTMWLNSVESYADVTGDANTGGFITLNSGVNAMSLTLGGAPSTGTIAITWVDRDV